jgi:hypothetical protein
MNRRDGGLRLISITDLPRTVELLAGGKLFEIEDIARVSDDLAQREVIRDNEPLVAPIKGS